MIDPAELAAELIRIPSESGDAEGMRAVQRRVAEAVGDGLPGLRVRTGGGERPWTLLSFDPTARGPMIACHTDTVPVGDAAAWSHDPLGAEVADGRLWGRGAVDMKGGLAAGAAALVAAARDGAPGHLLMTADEEIGALGARGAAQVLDDVPVAGVIIPEATQLRVRVRHRGACWLRLTSRGRAAHGSAPHRGVNAVLRLAGAVTALLPTVPLREHPELGPETASLGTFAGGIATNIVPDLATATVDQRTVGRPDALLAHWRAGEGIDEVETLLDLPPLLTDPADPFVAALPAAVDPEPVTYFTDGSVLQAAHPGLPVVVWGPGEPERMHAVDECLEVERLREAAELFAQVLSGGR